jgi:glc operon protein GlcG
MPLPEFNSTSIGGMTMIRNFVRAIIVAAALLLIASSAFPQAPTVAPPTTPYGAPINLDTAKKAAAASTAEARKNNWFMAVAVVDTAGNLVYFEKLDNTQAASVDIALDKARSAAQYRRPTKVFQDAVAAGGEGLRFLGLRGAVPAEGGFPIISDGKVVGAIGVSGGAGAQDSQVAKAGADTIR